MAGTYTPPTAGEKRTTGDKKAREALEGFNNLLEGSNKIPGTSLAAAAAIADTQLASPNNSAYRTIFSVNSTARAELAAGTWPLSNQLQAPLASGTDHAIQPVLFFHFAKADYEVAGKTQKLRVRFQTAVNATKPTITFTGGLYPITVAGAGTELVLTLGTVVSGSTVALAEPAASTVTQGNSGDFTIPSDGAFMLGFVTSAKLTANSNVKLGAQLQTRNV